MATVQQQASVSQGGLIQLNAEDMRANLNELSLKLDEHTRLVNSQTQSFEQFKEQMNQ